MNSLLGDRIRVLRMTRGLTQEQVAEKIGMSRQRYARMENGVTSISLDILSKVSELFGVTIHDITRVLDEAPSVAYRTGDEENSPKKIFDMLDLFYANKHLYQKLQH